MSQEHLIGAQAIYQKLDRSNFEEDLKDAHVIQLRDQLFQLLSQKETTYHKTVVERLCMSLAYIALHTSSGCWPKSMQEIITYGSSYGPHECFFALTILKNICITFDQKMFSQKQTALVKRWLNESVKAVFEFLSLILSGKSSLPHEVYLVCLSVAKHWCAFSKKSFSQNGQFIQTLFSLLGQSPPPEILKKILNIIKKMLSTSDFAKQLANHRYEQVSTRSDLIPPSELSFVKMVIDWLFTNR